MANPLSFLLGLGGALGGYNQGAEQADAADNRRQQLKLQAEQMARENYLRQQQLNQQNTQFGLSLKDAQAGREAEAKKEADRLKFQGEQAKTSRRDYWLANRSKFAQGEVGLPLEQQQADTEAINPVLSELELRPFNVPNTPTGKTIDKTLSFSASPLMPLPQVRGDLYGLAHGGVVNRDAPFTATTQEPEMYPGFAPDASTAKDIAETDRITALTNDLPRQARAAETQQQRENRIAERGMSLRERGFTADQINNAREQALRERLARMAQAGETNRLRLTQDAEDRRIKNQQDFQFRIAQTKASTALTPGQKAQLNELDRKINANSDLYLKTVPDLSKYSQYLNPDLYPVQGEKGKEYIVEGLDKDGKEIQTPLTEIQAGIASVQRTQNLMRGENERLRRERDRIYGGSSGSTRTPSPPQRKMTKTPVDSTPYGNGQYKATYTP